MIHATIDCEHGHGKIALAGRYVPAERDTGTPESFEIESASVNGTEIDLSDEQLAEAIDALREARGELLAGGA